MAVRKHIQKWGEKGRQKAAEARQAIDDRDDVVSSVFDGTEKLVKKTGEKISSGIGWAVEQGAARIGSDKYREELDAAMQEAIRVITVQEERIAVLEELLRNRNGES